MREVVFVLLLSSLFALAGCRGTDAGANGAGEPRGGTAAAADALVSELKAFTDELVGKVESAREPSEGVAEAQKLLESRRDALAARINSAKKGEQDAATRRKWLEAEVDGTDRVSRLQVKYLDASMRDPALKARLDKLVGDYGAIFKDR
ncbi:MAG: hypothetical protein H7Z38_02130 [Rubrivivax sp.]|nr:hypothetical protein [Pyrinomonadaceae bacterium]